MRLSCCCPNLSYSAAHFDDLSSLQKKRKGEIETTHRRRFDAALARLHVAMPEIQVLDSSARRVEGEALSRAAGVALRHQQPVAICLQAERLSVVL